MESPWTLVTRTASIKYAPRFLRRFIRSSLPDHRRFIAVHSNGQRGQIVWDTATSMSYALLVYKWIPSKVREFVMATYSASVRRQGPADTEHCSADPERLATIGRARGQQVRIKRSASEFAL